MAEARFRAFDADMVPKRPACIRCRQQKLRCLFDDDNSLQCTRCSRAQVKCEAALARQVRRPDRYKAASGAPSSLSRVSGPESTGSEVGAQRGVSLGLATNDNPDTDTTYLCGSSSSQLYSQKLSLFNPRNTRTGPDADFIPKSGAGCLQPDLSNTFGNHNLNEVLVSTDMFQNASSDIRERVRASFMKELSELNISLYQQLACINTTPLSTNLQAMLNIDPETDGSKPSNSISNIMDSSNMFLDILKRYSKFVNSLQTPNSPQSTMQSQGSIDESGVLSIMSCYTRILRIYNIIYFHIHLNFLSDPHHPPHIGLHINGSSLQSSELQIMVLTTIVLKAIYAMGNVLRVPKGFRVIENDEVYEGMSLLGGDKLARVEKLVAQVLAQEEVGEVWKGMGGVKSLMESMRGIKSLMAKNQTNCTVTF